MEATSKGKNIPIALSMSGQNAHYHHCEIFAARSSYAVCLHTIAAFERSVEDQLRLECSSAISGGSCPALAYREQERAAGEALFYQHRDELRKHYDDLATSERLDIRYGKSRSAAKNDRERERDSARELRELSSRRAEQATAEQATIEPAKKADKGLDAEVIGRNLIAESINAIIGVNKA